MTIQGVLQRLAALALCALLGACVTKPMFAIETGAEKSNLKSGISIAVVDKRPAEDRESSIGSLLASSDSYGIFTIGDERFSPAPALALTNRAERVLAGVSPRPTSVTITLKRFKTQNNMQVAMRDGAINASGLGWLGVEIAEGIFGKLREQNVDAKKPFILTYAEMTVDFNWPDNKQTQRNVTALKASNYAEGSTNDQNAVIPRTVASMLDTLGAGLKAAAVR